MASHLQSVYATLEARVAEKTRSLETRNRELATLLDATTALNDAPDIEALCGVFLRLILPASGAVAGAVRLRQPGSSDLHVYATEGLTPRVRANGNVRACPRLRVRPRRRARPGGGRDHERRQRPELRGRRVPWRGGIPDPP